MSSHSLTHLSDGTLRRTLTELTASDRATTARLLAHLGEFDARRLYAEDGFPSSFKYCVDRLHFSEDMAFKRIRAARVTRRFPFFLKAIADGHVHLTAVVMLTPHLNPDNAQELLAAATHKTKAEIEKLLAERFPQPDMKTLLHALPVRVAPAGQVVPEPPVQAVPETEVVPEPPRGQNTLPVQTTPNRLVVPEPVAPAARLKPLAPGRYALQVTIGQDTHDKLLRLQDLLGHALPSGDVAQLLDRALDALLEKIEKAKCGVADRPRRSAPKPSLNPRYIPKGVRRVVWARDGGQCTFVSDSGQRCTERKSLEYDHLLEVARGGTATAAGVRLLCRTHNQYLAERTFGADFMHAKREQREELHRYFHTPPVDRALTPANQRHAK